MYYRVAFQRDPLLPWQWKSTALSSLNILLHWLRYYRAFPHDRLHIFSSSSREDLHDLPYRFTLPTSLPQVLAWMKLLTKMQEGKL